MLGFGFFSSLFAAAPAPPSESLVVEDNVTLAFNDAQEEEADALEGPKRPRKARTSPGWTIVAVQGILMA